MYRAHELKTIAPRRRWLYIPVTGFSLVVSVIAGYCAMRALYVGSLNGKLCWSCLLFAGFSSAAFLSSSWSLFAWWRTAFFDEHIRTVYGALRYSDIRRVEHHGGDLRLLNDSRPILIVRRDYHLAEVLDQIVQHNSTVTLDDSSSQCLESYRARRLGPQRYGL